MNSGSYMGTVYGFKISSINKVKYLVKLTRKLIFQKLSDIKNAQGRGNLIHFLAEIIENDFPDLRNFHNQIQDTIPACKGIYIYIRN